MLINAQQEHNAQLLIDMLTRLKDFTCRVVLIYKPPPSRKNKLTTNMYLDEFAQLVESVVITDTHILICGDFNLHVDDIKDTDAVRFLNILESFNLCQRVTGPTHKRGHTLDLLITRSDETLVNNTRVLPDVYSDHHLITCKLECPNPPLSKVLVSSLI